MRPYVWEMLGVTAGVVACGALALAVGCSSQQPSVAVQVPAAGDDVGPSFNVGSCQHYPQSEQIDRACMIDSNGNTYPENGTLWVFPPDPPYAVYYQFKPGYVPLAQDLDTTSDSPAIGVFAAPYDVQSTPCCAEDSLANRIPSQVTLTQGGGLLVTVTDALPFGDQLAVMLGFGGLYRSRLTPCTLPSSSACTWAPSSGFAVRFYVGSSPQGTPPPPPTVVPPAAGTCLLEYNDALVAAGADPCCYRQGGANTCHSITQCNDASGAGCCLVYGTEDTAGGGRCCLYESGDLGDDPTECQALLAAH